MRAPPLGSASAVPPSRRPCSSNQPSGSFGGANHQNDFLAEPSPMAAASSRGAPSTVRPFQTSTLASVKPASASLSSLRVALLAPVEARLVGEAGAGADLDQRDRARDHRPGAGACRLGRARKAGDALVVVLGGVGRQLEAVAAVGAAMQLHGQRLGGIELQGDQPLGLVGALRCHDRAARVGGLPVELLQRLADGVGRRLGVGGVDPEGRELVGHRAVRANGEGLDVFRGGRRCRLVGALRWFLLGALIWAIDPEAQTN